MISPTSFIFFAYVFKNVSLIKVAEGRIHAWVALLTQVATLRLCHYLIFESFILLVGSPCSSRWRIADEVDGSCFKRWDIYSFLE
jgi:hypothetical protein